MAMIHTYQVMEGERQRIHDSIIRVEVDEDGVLQLFHVDMEEPVAIYNIGGWSSVTCLNPSTKDTHTMLEQAWGVMSAIMHEGLTDDTKAMIKEWKRDFDDYEGV